MNYKVIYLADGPRRAEHVTCAHIEQATYSLRYLKRRGLTAWVETTDGTFVPVKGAMRKPAELV